MMHPSLEETIAAELARQGIDVEDLDIEALERVIDEWTEFYGT
jgi:hypothetical protein